MSRMLLMLWMVATVGCSLFPSAPSGVANTEISYRSLYKDRKYEGVKEVIFFGPVNKDMELKMEVIKITATDLPYQLSCPYAKYDYAYLYQVKLDKEVVNVETLTSDGAVIGDFRRSRDLVMYKPVYVDKMDWAVFIKTPNGKVTAKIQLVRTDGNKEQDNGTLNNQGDKNVSSGSTCNVFLYWSWIFFAVLVIESSVTDLVIGRGILRKDTHLPGNTTRILMFSKMRKKALYILTNNVSCK
uniref:Cadherin domain-containing protein n=1 Tax=Parastrongyloides trichosuri TaxID=131310 RepID=A0A0N4Z5Z1_PARTI